MIQADRSFSADGSAFHRLGSYTFEYLPGYPRGRRWCCTKNDVSASCCRTPWAAFWMRRNFEKRLRNHRATEG